MIVSTTINLKAPYLIFIGDCNEALFAKTGFGLVDWCPDKVLGQHSFDDNDLSLGVAELSLEEAVARGAKSLVIGVAPVGGDVGSKWKQTLRKAAELGMDVVSGLHFKLQDIEEIAKAANTSGAALINVRTPPPELPIGNGEKRTGNRVLMVGTDCAVGKKYTALALTRDMQHQNLHAEFRATGQTGIMIAGSGIAVDAVVADFIAGAAELVSPANEKNHWDIIEGQGSLFNPAYAGVSLGLLHGSQASALVLCHDVMRESISSVGAYSMPGLQECIDLNLQCARLTSPDVYCAGVSVNTSGLAENQRQNYLDKLNQELNLPCIDPIFSGCKPIVENLLANRS